jgi:L-asparagine transporter-like permease
VLCVVSLRRKHKDAPRPYRATAYPLPAVVYALSSVVVLVLVVFDREPSVLVAVAWFAGALSLWTFVLARRRAPPRP